MSSERLVRTPDGMIRYGIVPWLRAGAVAHLSLTTLIVPGSVLKTVRSGSLRSFLEVSQFLSGPQRIVLADGFRSGKMLGSRLPGFQPQIIFTFLLYEQHSDAPAYCISGRFHQ